MIKRLVAKGLGVWVRTAQLAAAASWLPLPTVLDALGLCAKTSTENAERRRTSEKARWSITVKFRATGAINVKGGWVLGVELSEEMNGRKRHQAGALE